MEKNREVEKKKRREKLVKSNDVKSDRMKEIVMDKGIKMEERLREKIRIEEMKRN